jgi:UDP-N-acetyl-D-mannosaminuronic acid transferase (WecB/TagA/CpsF family)
MVAAALVGVVFRLIMNPRRMWRRYIIGNAKFLCYIMKEKNEKR